MDNFQFSFESAHPKAQAVMKEAFYFSPIEESAPFGSDGGSDAAYQFRDWRLTNKTTSPIVFLHDLIRRWDLPFFDYKEMDTTKINEYLNHKKELSEVEIQKRIKELRDVEKESPGLVFLEQDEEKIRASIIATSSEMNQYYLVDQDNAIIGIGFAQFVLEGHIDADMKALTITAIERQLLPMLINRYVEEHSNIRKYQLGKMLDIIKAQ